MEDHVLLETCPLCSGALEAVRDAIAIRVGQRSVSVPVDHQRCTDCGETYFSPQAADEAQRIAAATVRHEEGLLQPEEIRRIRQNLRLTQSQFEALIGVGPKTVVRWENGYVFQNAATDTLLRVLRAVPEAVAFLTSMRRDVQIRAGLALTVSDLIGPAIQRSYHYASVVEHETQPVDAPVVDISTERLLRRGPMQSVRAEPALFVAEGGR